MIMATSLETWMQQSSCSGQSFRPTRSASVRTCASCWMRTQALSTSRYSLSPLAHWPAHSAAKSLMLSRVLCVCSRHCVICTWLALFAPLCVACCLCCPGPEVCTLCVRNSELLSLGSPACLSLSQDILKCTLMLGGGDVIFLCRQRRMRRWTAWGRIAA